MIILKYSLLIDVIIIHVQFFISIILNLLILFLSIYFINIQALRDISEFGTILRLL